MELFSQGYLDEYSPDWQGIILDLDDEGFFDNILSTEDPDGLIPDETAIRIIHGEIRKRQRRYDPYLGLTFAQYLSVPLRKRFKDVARAIKASEGGAR